MVMPAQEGRTRSQRITIGLTAVMAVFLLVVSILVVTLAWFPLTFVGGFVQFALEGLLVIGMLRGRKIFYLGTLGVNGGLFLLGLGARVIGIRQDAFTLSWFPFAFAFGLALHGVIVYFAWRAFREM